ncbi:hypothetical protein [Mucilaginibacter sp.]|jgi:hypothetical protein|uniref:hypothetical protein n=1 Tax=Mucilaginibacter sp. TaxID=1882438 RepID=UPI0035656021
MVPFNLDLELTANPVTITVEQLDRLADEDGFIRFDVSCAERRSVVFVNMENELPPVTSQDAEAYFEAVNYPEQVSAFSEDEVFTPEEVKAIAAAIRKYNNELKVRFAKFMFGS